MVERAPFPLRPDSILPADLLGPYDGVVLDAESERPVAGAVVAGSWAFERGIGLVGPLTAIESVTETGADGRYVIPRPHGLPSGLSTRVRRFTLIVYHRGHVGWRSDRRFRDASPRRDFCQRGNRVFLERWQSRDLHHKHLVFIGGGEKIRTAAAWEIQPAVMELEGERPGVVPLAPGSEERPTTGAAPLDASPLLTQDDIRSVTGYVGKFEEGKLADLPTTEFYDSRHFKAEGRAESYDVAMRVWRLGPAAAEAQYRKLLAELPGARSTDELADASLRARSGEVSALAFLSRERGFVVTITCGTAQCTEPAMIGKLSRLVEGKLVELPAPPAPGEAPPPKAPGSEPKKEEP